LQNKLRRVMYRSELKAKAEQLEALAYATPQRNRIIGSPGHNATINWIVDTIKKYPEYYTYELQPFDLRLGVGGNLTLNGVSKEAYTTDLSAEGSAEGEVVVIKNLACDLVSLRTGECLALSDIDFLSRATSQPISPARSLSSSVVLASLVSRSTTPDSSTPLVLSCTITLLETVRSLSLSFCQAFADH